MAKNKIIKFIHDELGPLVIKINANNDLESTIIPENITVVRNHVNSVKLKIHVKQIKSIISILLIYQLHIKSNKNFSTR